MTPSLFIATILCIMATALSGCERRQVQLQSVRGQTVDHWVNELKRPEPKARTTALSALQSVGAADPAAVPAIIGALNDRDAKVRDAAVIALLNIGPPAKDAVGALKRAKTDRDASVRAHAKAALQRIEPSG